ncbi:MAG: lysylphosphatidylglycerol synthase domain-containing protein [Bacteroidetes bacterium]|nr:lysylphosphatidylglycerol synthase domain-containing protein [Bacteroidota bacterium]
MHQSWQMIKDAFYGTSNWKIVLVIVLMFLNYGIEARKWQILINRIENIGFGKAFKATLTGQAFAINTINRSGDFVGRILYLQEGNRLRAVALSLIGSMSQILATFFFGFVALASLKFSMSSQLNLLVGLSEVWQNALLITLFIGILVFTIFYYNISIFIQFVEKIPFMTRFKFLIEKLEALHWRELTRILCLSVARYVVFIVQYVLLLRVFGMESDLLNIMMMVSVFFLVMAVIPSIALAELGFRGKLSLQLFGLLSSNHLGIIAAAATIWIINLIIPAIAGSVLILGVRLFKNKLSKKQLD